jgi:valyl-tRNA synthetase
VFIRLYNDGMIYRGPRLVNWSPGLQTAVSDVEVERDEELGKLYTFNYPVEGGAFLPVATTRPETILGDTAVCVHPDDERYRHLIGKTAYVPMLNRAIPVIADAYVDRAFGTGALKITPAHDFNDYEIGARHKLPLVSIMNKDGTINAEGGPYAGLDRFECRKKLWADMEAAGLTIKVEDHLMVVPRSQRGGEVIEPLLSTQWWMRMKPLAERAIAAVRDGRIKIVPERFEKIYFNWLENIEDWCVSRQLWWGHRIPAWYGPNGEIHVGLTPPAGDGWTPDEDVLDTWFSSGLWPFSTLGWPEQTPDFKRFYPTSVMETGYDILFFWVARMVMLGLWFTDDVPFRAVYLHGLVRDAQGRKISKTLGNTIDPLDLIDKFGTDPLRFTLVTSGTPGNDLNLDTARIEGEYRFVNKIWQMTNFVVGNLGDEAEAASLLPGAPPTADLDLPSRWMLSRLNRLIASVQRLFDAYQFGEAGRQIRGFLWDEFADWFIEISKAALYGDDPAAKAATRRVLVHVLDTALRLLHPFMPFATEAAWGYLPKADGEAALIIAKWPTADASRISDADEATMNALMDIVRGVRNVRAEYNVDPGRRVAILAQPGSYRQAIQAHAYLFSRLCNVESVTLTDAAPDEAASVVVGDATVYLPLAGLIDYAAEIDRLEKELGKLSERIARSEGMLNNEGFVARAKPEVVARERESLAEMGSSAAQITARLDALRARTGA